MVKELEKQFHTAMLAIYTRAKSEVGYNATRFLRMVSEQGGYETARTLLYADKVSDGYVALWERGRLDLTVQALILEPQWQALFTETEREISKRRLSQYGYTFTGPT